MTAKIQQLSQRTKVLRWIALVSWVLIVLAHLILFVFDLITDYADMVVPCTGLLGSGGTCNFLAISAAEVAVLTSWGLTTRAYAVAMLIPPIIFLLGYWLLGGLILWRQGTSRTGLIVSLALVVFPIATVSGDNDWSGIAPALFFLAAVVSFVGNVIVVSFLYLLPNGRFSPKWAYIPWAGTVLLLNVQSLKESSIIILSPQALSLLYISFVNLVLFGGGLQIYRYLRDANTVERQQTKWITFGILSYGLSVIVWILIFGSALTIPSGIPRLLANLGGWFFIDTFSILILPAAITIAILRYKLWDIDILIRKTLVYVGLTGLLALVYFGLVVLLQSVFNVVSDQQSPAVIVISTLVIAALFAPLRRRVQAFIDRRFFRRKYDAERVLAQFAQTARDETDLDRLTSELVRVVQETMQPESVSVWLKESNAKTQGRRGAKF